MKSRHSIKHLAVFLCILMIFSPISFAMSSVSLSHSEIKNSSEMATQITARITSEMHHESHSLSSINEHFHDKTNSQIDNTDDCKSECANCVYCNASSITSSDSSLMLYTVTHFEITKYFLKSINHSVDIRPPINR